MKFHVRILNIFIFIGLCINYSPVHSSERSSPQPLENIHNLQASHPLYNNLTSKQKKAVERMNARLAIEINELTPGDNGSFLFINDAVVFNNNGDYTFDAYSSFQIELSLTHFGTEDLNNITAKVRSLDDHVIIKNNTFKINKLRPLGSYWLTADQQKINAIITADMPAESHLFFEISFTNDDEYQQTSTFEIVLPEYKILNPDGTGDFTSFDELESQQTDNMYVYITSGEYWIDDAIDITKSNVQIFGAPHDKPVLKGTDIPGNNEEWGLIHIWNNFLLQKSVTIRNLKLTNPTTNAAHNRIAAVTINPGVNNVRIEYNDINHFKTSTSESPNFGVVAYDTKNVLVRNNSIANIDRGIGGINIFSPPQLNHNYIGNRIISASSNGIDHTGISFSDITGNLIKNGGQTSSTNFRKDGIRQVLYFDAGDNYITNNVVHDFEYNVVEHSTSGPGNLYLGNHFVNASESDIYFWANDFASIFSLNSFLISDSYPRIHYLYNRDFLPPTLSLPNKGNFWNTYEGTDVNEDNIGDQPYEIKTIGGIINTTSIILKDHAPLFPSTLYHHYELNEEEWNYAALVNEEQVGQDPFEYFPNAKDIYTHPGTIPHELKAYEGYYIKNNVTETRKTFGLQLQEAIFEADKPGDLIFIGAPFDIDLSEHLSCLSYAMNWNADKQKYQRTYILRKGKSYFLKFNDSCQSIAIEDSL